RLESVPSGTLVNVFIRNKKTGKKAEEDLALDRIRTVFHTLQHQTGEDLAPALHLETTETPEKKVSNGNGRRPIRPRPRSGPTARPTISTAGPPVLSFNVVINKQ